jgi:formate dehydrogenase major subunit
MTNNWVDLAYSTCFIVQGANPVENHPASIAHLNAARFDTNGRGRNAALVVIDPRQTRTARMINAGYVASNPNDMRKHDRYVRIRPGTNVAFNNGVLNSIITWMYANPTDQRSINFFAWHNGTATNSLASRAVITDPGNGSTVANWPKYCDSRIKLTANGQDYQRTTVTAANAEDVSNFPLLAANIDDAECVFQRLRAHVAKYTSAAVADICGCTTADIAAVRDAYIDNSRFASSDFGAAAMTQNAAGYRAACIMYAMGATQFTTGSQGIRGYAQIQTMMGNMGRCGGGINALRGIHNVQGSTDMGVLFDLIPGYSGNPGVGVSYPAYSNALFGNRVLETDVTRPTARSAYTAGDLGLQQRGFYNMTREWFGDRTVTSQADFDKLWDLWPKGNGVQHIEAFRRMCPESGADYTYTPVAGAPRISACVVWGQNPAITEPNQGAVRTGLYNLDLLVVADMFATETAQCSRKGTGVTYLLPSCSHVEEAGSVSSSGRWIQWRDKAVAPRGNSKADLELLLKLAKALDGAGAFSHITGQWATMGTAPSGSAYDVLYGKYGWDGTGSMEDVSGLDAESVTLTGSEYVAEQIYKEMCAPLDAATGPAGTLWIYSGMGAAAGYSTNTGDVQPTVGLSWGVANRAKSRQGRLAGAATASGQYPRYGWAWLLNRRIFYNNGELTGDVGDVFVAPGFIARLYTINTNTLADWSTLYRAYNTLADMPNAGTGAGNINGDPHVYPGRLPAYTEPYESPRPDLVTKWGKNTANGASLIMADTPIGAVADFPLVMTSIRCVEHFQGGPITRNNAWNVDAEPEPWIEINSADAIKYGITDGMYVNVVTARGNSVSDQEARTAGGALAPESGWAKGFKARVGVGTLANQRVAPGTVAIPWHWGDRGLGVGSRANDLCIDSWDANTRIPEYKACLCRIEPATT